MIGVVLVIVGLGQHLRSRTVHLTRVPVDDFVVGDLPMVCAVSGETADGLVDFESGESAFQPWWLLLLLAGPFGIVGIALLHGLSRRPERVGGSLPMTSAALAAHNRGVSVSTRAWLVPLVGFVLGGVIMSVSSHSWTAAIGLGVLVAGLLGGFTVLFLASSASRSQRVEVRLDGSGRWVELRNVHPDFAAAVDRQVRENHRRRRRRQSQHPDL